MLLKLCAVLLLALAVSPLTAPFQTYDEARATIVAPINGEDDPGSLLGPLATRAGRIKASVAAPPVVAAPFNESVTFFGSPTHSASHAHTELRRVLILRI